MSKKRTEIWAGLIVLAIGVIPVAFVGLWVYMRATATPLHPNPQDTPSVTQSAPCQSGRRRRAGATDRSCSALLSRRCARPVEGLQIFEPLGMRDTYADSATEPSPTRATFYNRPIAPDATAAGPGGGDWLRSRLGSRDRGAWGEETRWVGHDGETLGGLVASLLTFPEHGIVVSAISNISYADTAGLALKIAQSFYASLRKS